MYVVSREYQKVPEVDIFLEGGSPKGPQVCNIAILTPPWGIRTAKKERKY